MKAFIVYCHPSEDSFTRNIRDAFIKGITDSENMENYGLTRSGNGQPGRKVHR